LSVSFGHGLPPASALGSIPFRERGDLGAVGLRHRLNEIEGNFNEKDSSTLLEHSAFARDAELGNCAAACDEGDGALPRHVVHSPVLRGFTVVGHPLYGDLREAAFIGMFRPLSKFAMDAFLTASASPHAWSAPPTRTTFTTGIVSGPKRLCFRYRSRKVSQACAAIIMSAKDVWMEITPLIR
jgi:hypothetical protein